MKTIKTKTYPEWAEAAGEVFGTLSRGEIRRLGGEEVNELSSAADLGREEAGRRNPRDKKRNQTASEENMTVFLYLENMLNRSKKSTLITGSIGT